MKHLTVVLAAVLLAACTKTPENTPGTEDTSAIPKAETGNIVFDAAFNAMRPQLNKAHEAAAAGLQAHGDKLLAASKARQERIALERAAAAPKAYRWKDESGQWHISDVAPPSGTDVEIIHLAQ